MSFKEEEDFWVRKRSSKDYPNVNAIIRTNKAPDFITSGLSGIKVSTIGLAKIKIIIPIDVKKINDIRRLGGLALFASDYEQVEEYIIKKDK